MKLLVTGGAGFIGSSFVRMALTEGWAESVVNVDKLTYAGNLDNLRPIAGHPGYKFVQLDICDASAVDDLFRSESPDAVVHFAAESHVDRSIHSPAPVILTNFNGTFSLLEAARANKIARFVHVSTDEVYGSIEPPHEADETYPVRTSSPYSASKAGSDLLALSYFTTYKLNVSVTRASNNYGPYQFPEKLIPLTILNAIEHKPLPVYGNGGNVRDWLHVEDHAAGLVKLLSEGKPGEKYNFGGDSERSNLDVVTQICDVVDRLCPGSTTRRSMITFVPDRPGHDVRYAIDASKAHRELGWQPTRTFEEGLTQTVSWYLNGRAWWERARSGVYDGSRLGLLATQH
jgi:dTDP-glucose 4,6-dehydratase